MLNIIQHAAIRLCTKKPFLHHLFNGNGQIIYTLTFTPKKVNRYTRRKLPPDSINKAIITVTDNYTTVKYNNKFVQGEFSPFITKFENALYNLSIDYANTQKHDHVTEEDIKKILLTHLFQNRPEFLRKHKIEITKINKRYA